MFRIPFFPLPCVAGIIALLFALVPAAALRAAIEPVFQSDGTILVGAHRVVLRPEGIIHLTDPEGVVYDLFMPLGYVATSSGLWPKDLKERKLTVDEKNCSTTFSGRAEPPAGPPVNVIYRISLTEKGFVRVALKFTSSGVVTDHLTIGNRLHVPRPAVIGDAVRIGQRQLMIENVSPGSIRQDLGIADAGEDVVLNAGTPDRRIVFHPVDCAGIHVRDNNLTSYRGPFFELIFGLQNNEVVYDIELPRVEPSVASSETYEGIDFWQHNRLRMPNYMLSRNLVQNPGFEAGFTYWRWNSLGSVSKDTSFSEYYRIVEGGSQSGNRHLALRGEPGISPAQAATFAIPVEKGAEYTLSFYARGEHAGQRLGLNAQGYFQPASFPLSTKVTLTDQWRRYTFTFRTPQSVLSVGFDHHDPAADSWVFVDSVQLEKAGRPTSFTSKPVIGWLQGGGRERMWQPGENPHAALHLAGVAGLRGTVRLRQTDFFGVETHRGTLPFLLDETGRAVLPLAWAVDLPLGIHELALEVKTADGFAGTDYDRFTVMRFLENKHRHKDMFCAHLVGGRYVEWDREAEFFKRIGIGSTILPDPGPHGYQAALQRQGIFYFSSIFDGGGQGYRALNWFQHENGFDGITPEFLEGVEKEAYLKAREYPEIKYWKSLNEPTQPPYIDNPPAMKKVNAVVRAARRGLLRGNPDAIMIGNDPSNMYANSGVAYVNTQLEVAGGEKLFEIAAIHPYRARPEEPDLDGETRAFLAMLDRNKFAGDVWFTEGIYHNNYIVPAWDLNSHVACSTDHWRAGDLSYAIGWGERIAAAYTARSRVMNLKYADRVKLSVDWGARINAFCDINYTPMAQVFATNTLGHILGNADFRSDVALGYQVRAYVFEDEARRPVAVLWYSNIDVDKGKIAGPELDISSLKAGKSDFGYTDFMGNRHTPGERIGLSPFPIFIHGEPGELRSFTERLERCSLVNESGNLHAWADLKNGREIEVVIENALGREYRGSAVLRNGGHIVFQGDIVIPAKERWRRLHSLAEQTSTKALTTTSLRLEITAAGKREARSFDLNLTAMAWPRLREPISFTGKPAEWARAFSTGIENRIDFVPYGPAAYAKYWTNRLKWTGPGDLAARFYATWDDQNLYLAFAVQDDTHDPFPDSLNAWQGDSIQLFFDAWADASHSRANGYGPDDQSFQLWPSVPSGVVYRDSPPERQLAFLDAGPVKAARVAVNRLGNGLLFYEIALPMAELNPLQLRTGGKFAFAVVVNDRDKDYRKHALTLTPAGTEPYRRPDLYPVIILVP